MDTSEVNRYKKLLDTEQSLNKRNKEEIDSLRFQLKIQQDVVYKLEQEIVEMRKSAVTLSNAVTSSTRTRSYKLFMEKVKIFRQLFVLARIKTQLTSTIEH